MWDLYRGIFPFYMIWSFYPAISDDFLRGEYALAHNGKNGIAEENIQMHHTWKSILYGLVR